MHFTHRLESAIVTAAKAHRKQMRKGSDIPYIIHPFSVMTVASEVTEDEDTLIACLFHDILEDVPEEYSEQQMRDDYGQRVVDIVRGVTKDDSIEDWREANEAYLQNLRENASDESVIVSAADKIHNLISVLEDYDEMGDAVWQKFTTKNADDQLWWYEAVLETVRARSVPTPLSEHLAGLVVDLRGRLKG